jgi:hypothetical protein
MVRYCTRATALALTIHPFTLAHRRSSGLELFIEPKKRGWKSPASFFLTRTLSLGLSLTEPVVAFDPLHECTGPGL